MTLSIEEPEVKKRLSFSTTSLSIAYTHVDFFNCLLCCPAYFRFAGGIPSCNGSTHNLIMIQPYGGAKKRPIESIYRSRPPYMALPTEAHLIWTDKFRESFEWRRTTRSRVPSRAGLKPRRGRGERGRQSSIEASRNQ